jgi:hypothetical protein
MGEAGLDAYSTARLWCAIKSPYRRSPSPDRSIAHARPALRRDPDARAKELVGDHEPRQHGFSVQLRAFDNPRSGSGVGVAVLLALCSSLLQKSIKCGLAVSGGLNLGGSIPWPRSRLRLRGAPPAS